MALQSSGAISLDDMHVELGESSGTQCSINDSDIRGLIDKSSGATMSFNEWYGASNITYMAASGGTTSTSGILVLMASSWSVMTIRDSACITFSHTRGP